MTHLLIQRVSRIEDLCFNDRLDAEGTMERPSLQTSMRVVYGHISVVCAWARGIVKLSKLVAAIGVISAVVVACVHFARII